MNVRFCGELGSLALLASVSSLLVQGCSSSSTASNDAGNNADSSQEGAAPERDAATFDTGGGSTDAAPAMDAGGHDAGAQDAGAQDAAAANDGSPAVNVYCSGVSSGIVFCQGWENLDPMQQAAQEMVCTGTLMGSLVSACPTSNLNGCCTSVESGGLTTEVCFYSGSASDEQAQCNAMGSTWSTTP